ncbi:hypothetical protein [Campylobacter ureolyticus]|uniref:Uncharacterized protein n=1 Tax=Campylobacter ureolyticus TaxID=827 RepID=A0A9Q4KM00_9BACT|nr:hypothetical protein [Campylobacter ureolyticus]MCZ6159013.1 hypothetical protein [Campylobacter ureolyticus]MCZ6162906.1 hypothetical protein [Campylobacter ureolyticus]MCZ6164601.1 hypothetical protein [Campylobacter ureolyticus]
MIKIDIKRWGRFWTDLAHRETAFPKTKTTKKKKKVVENCRKIQKNREIGTN